MIGNWNQVDAHRFWRMILGSRFKYWPSRHGMKLGMWRLNRRLLSGIGSAVARMHERPRNVRPDGVTIVLQSLAIFARSTFRWILHPEPVSDERHWPAQHVRRFDGV